MTTNHFERQDIGYVLTAYADGQLAPEGVMWVEEQLDANGDLRARLKEIRQLQAGLRAAFAGGAPDFVLDLPRREALLASAANPPRKRIRFQPLLWSGLAASIVAVVMVTAMPDMRYAARSSQATAARERAEYQEGWAAKPATLDQPATGVNYFAEAKAADALAEPAPVNAPALDLALARNDEEVAALRERNRALDDELDVRRRGLAEANGLAGKVEPERLAKGDQRDAGRGGAEARKAFGVTPAVPPAPAQPVQEQLAQLEADAKPAAKEAYRYRQAPAETAQPAAPAKPAAPVAAAAPVVVAAPAAPSPVPPAVVPPQEGQRLARADRRPAAAPGAAPQGGRANENGGAVVDGREAGGARLEVATTTTASFGGAAGPSAGEKAKSQAADGLQRSAEQEKTTLAAGAAAESLDFRGKLAEDRDDSARTTGALAKLEQKRQEADKAGADAAKDRAAAAPAGRTASRLVDESADQKQAAAAARALPAATTADPQRSLAALRAPVTVDGVLPLAEALRMLAGEHTGFTLAHGVDAALGRRVQVALRDEPAARGILRAARAVGLQAQFTGGLVRLDSATRPLDPGDAQGFDLPTFKDLFGTQPMQPIAVDPVQTVAIDADTASYEYARARVAAGQPVDPATIKPEHFINAMPMDYPAAHGPEAFSLYAEAAPSPFARPNTAWGPRTALVSIGAVAKPAAADERKPLALTLAIDCSGSMAQPGGLDRIRSGLAAFIGHLRAEDRVAIVAFGDQARVVLPATPGNDRAALGRALAELSTGGATNAAEGLGLAYQLAAETTAPGVESRVLLATDGGTVAGADDLLRRVTAFKDRGVSLVVVGTGATYRAGPLQELASKGDGQHFYVGSDADAEALFTGRLLPDRLALLARDAKLQVTWNPQRVSHARLVGYDQRRLAAKDFRNNAVDAGELSQDTQVTALFEVLLVDGGAGPLGTAAVRYHDMRREQVRELACPLPGTILQSQPSDRLRLLACAAATAEWLQRGWWSNVHLITPDEIRAQLARCPQPVADDLRALVQ